MGHADLIDLSEDMRNAADPFVPFERFVAARGARGFFYGFMAMTSDRQILGYTGALYSRHTYPTAWSDAVGEQALLDNDISLDMMAGGQDYTPWRPEDYDAFIGGMRPAQRRQYELEQDLGIRYGASLILDKGFDGEGVSGLGYWHEDMVSPQAFDREWAEHGPAIWQAGRMLDTAVRRERPNLLIRLSPREQDCLSWLAVGQRPAEICWRLQISEKTFEKHIARAKAKLKSRTRDQAVAKAVLLGLVQV